MRLGALLAAVCLTVVAVPARAQDTSRYLMLAATRTGTMQNEINDAAARGFRVVAASRTEGAEVIVALEKASGGYSYRLISTTRTGTLQKELTEAVEAGFRVVPRAVTTKKSVGSLMSNGSDEGELLILMERGPQPVAGLSYKVVATTRTATLQKEMSDTAAQGFELIALTSRGEHVAIFERAR